MQPKVPLPLGGEVYLRRGDYEDDVERAEAVGGAEAAEGVLGWVESEASEAAVRGCEGGEEGEESG